MSPEEPPRRLERYTFVETLTDDVPDIKQIDLDVKDRLWIDCGKIWKPRRSSLELIWLPMDGLRLVDDKGV